MSDFAQSGLICTLQRLNDSHLGNIEAELAVAVVNRPVALVLPCHASELGRSALAGILDELSGASWLSEVVVSMNGLNAEGFARAEHYFSKLPQPVRVLWNDRPGLATHGFGKGANVAAGFELLCAEQKASYIATQDCDVASFSRSDLARICYAPVCLGFRFAKAYYSRVTDRMYGRVSRLFLAPLLHAMVRVSGHLPLVDFLLSFRYPLAGECVIETRLAAQLRVASGWKLEIGQLCEIFRHVDPREICQVDGGVGYDHKHQPALTNLAGMASEIAAELFDQLEMEGGKVGQGFRSAIIAAYEQESELALRRYGALARINALPFDESGERATIAAFAKCLVV